MAYKIRLMKKEDIPQVIKIYSQTDKKDAKSMEKLYKEFYKKPNKKKTVKDFVITNKDEVIGFSGFSIDETGSDNVYWVNWTAVDKKYQGQGFATQLLNHVFEKLNTLKARKLYVTTTTELKYKPAVKFYQSVGFKTEAKLKDYYKKGVDSIMLGKVL